MPVKMLVILSRCWPSVQNVVVGRVVQSQLDATKGVLQTFSKRQKFRVRHLQKTGLVRLGENARLKWKTGGKRLKGDEGIEVSHYAILVGNLLTNYVAKNTAFLETVIPFGSVNFLRDSFRNNRGGLHGVEFGVYVLAQA